MKAWVLHGVNEIRFETLEKPVPDRGEVLVAVRAVGICGSDIPRIYKTGAHRHPLIPGHEFAGVVEALGEGVDAVWQGKRVGIFPLIPCRSCLPCRNKQYEMCRNYDYLGSRRNGGFTEYVAVPVECLIELPQQVSFAEAAMLEPMAVAAHAMRRTMPETPYITENPDGTTAEAVKAAGKSGNADCIMAVYGLGTIGLLLVMLLLETRETEGKGSGTEDGRLLVIGNKDFQRQMILELGLPEDSYCDSRSQDVAGWLMERTQNRGVDVFFECVGKNETLQQVVDNAAPGGRICLVGNPYSDMCLEKSVYWKILRNQLTVMGTWNSSFLHEAEDDWAYVLKLLSQRRITPEKLISHRFPLDELERGLHIMRDKSEDYGKIILGMEERQLLNR